MSENNPSENEPQDAATAGGATPVEAAQSSAHQSHDAGAGDVQRPPLPEQSATQAAQTQAGAASATPPAAPQSAPPASGGYAAQAPYTAPAAPAGHTAPYGAPSFGTSAFGTQPTAPYGTAAPTVAGGPVHTAPHSADVHASGAKIGAGKIVGIMVAAALVGGAAGIGGAAAGASLFPQAQTVISGAPSTVTVNNTSSVNQTTAIAAKVVPSVVTISATSGSSGGTGSGVVLTSDGYVVTNTHVVTLDGQTGDAKLSVTASDGKVYAATIVGTDPTYDLAVIKLTDASGLTPIDFGDSSKLNVGDQTVAVGAPLGLSNTVTTGIVSALNRSIQIASSAAPEGDSQDQGQQPGDGGNGSPFQFDFGQGQQQSTPKSSISIAVIQTDAAINPGNSGGALVDGQGKLIGINVAIASAGGSSSGGQSGSIGVGFSIPSDIVKRVTDDLIKDGKATHGLLGAGVRDAASQEGATVAGAYIAEVTAGGAAAKAGLQKGDVVTSFNGFPVTNATDLTAQVRALAAGSTATIVYDRNGKTASAEVTLGELQ